MKAKPKKCRALAAKLFLASKQKMQWCPHSGLVFSTFDPLLTIAGQPVQAIGPQEMELEDTFKFLGRVFAYDLKEKKQEAMVQKRFSSRMQVIDKDLVSSLMKLWLYQFSVIPFLSLGLSKCMTFLLPLRERWRKAQPATSSVGLVFIAMLMSTFCTARERSLVLG